MEYLGYIAASNPPPSCYLQRTPPLCSSPPLLQRANSSKAASTSKQPRFPSDHRRTNSSTASSQGRLSHELASAPTGLVSTRVYPVKACSGTKACDGTISSSLIRQQSQPSPQRLVSASHRDKELPLLPLPPSGDPAGAETSAASSNRQPNPSFSFPSLSAPASPSRAVPLPSPTSGHKRRTNKIRTLSRHYSGQGRTPNDKDDPSRDPGHNQTHKHHGCGYHHEHGPEFYTQRLHDHLNNKQNKPISCQQQIHQQIHQRIHHQHHQPNYVSAVRSHTSLFSKHAAKANTKIENIIAMSAMTGALALSSKANIANELRASDGTGDAGAAEGPVSGGEGPGSGGEVSSILSAGSGQAKSKPYMVRNGRTYLSDQSLPYPLPVDMPEQHRQSLRSLLLLQLFGGPVCSPNFANKPPKRVLEVACGPAFWSIMCNQHYARQGHKGISFSGIDIAPLSVGLTRGSKGGKSGSKGISSTASGTSTEKAEADADGDADADSMNWRFVQHDVRLHPWPFEPGEFDLIMLKDASLTVKSDAFQLILDECIRLLEPGGTLEVWDSDHAIRLLRPHYPGTPGSAANGEEDEYESAASAGAYVITPKTPLSSPQNQFITEYNGWLVKAFGTRSLPFAPCALASAFFLQEVDSLKNASMRRLAVPLSEMRWEREGVGGVVTKDGKTYVESKGKSKAMGPDEEQSKNKLTAAQSALRRTALLTVLQMIQSLEPVLREVSGKSQDEWDGWSGKMMNNLMKENGTFWGECLEVGAWWAEKR